jgi:adenylate cyclase
MTGRKRREWRIMLWAVGTSAIASAWFGYGLGDQYDNHWRGALQGVVSALLIATPIVFVEVKTASLALTRRLRRLPLVVYLAIKLAFYVTVIVGGMILGRILFGQMAGLGSLFNEVFLFAVAMAVVGNLFFEAGRLLGYGTMVNLLLGRYVHPRQVERGFLLIDMKDSTGLAERLGAVRFHELLNVFFRDTADAGLECGAEIYKYVGDEAILTWSDARALKSGDCLACPFTLRDLIAANAAHYAKRFGAVPEFRAALHYGEIVAGEIGDVRREIAYVGDTLNVAARLLEAAKTTGRDVIVSSDLLARATLPPGVRVEKLPVLAVRGRAQPLEIAALTLSS